MSPLPGARAPRASVGLAGQQLANDPGGDRYIRLIAAAVTMFADRILGPGRPRRASAPARPAHPDDRNGQT